MDYEGKQQKKRLIRKNKDNIYNNYCFDNYEKRKKSKK